jgi:hypothetical protein
MDTLSLLPNAPLLAAGPISIALKRVGCHSCQSAALALLQLPYGRNDDPSNPLCVIEERRGTCSTRHALLKRLLDEQEFEDAELRTGIYEMTEANTPRVGPILEAHGLSSIPEAHCYLVLSGERLDITRILPAEVEPITTFLLEQTITPDQTTTYKRDFHRRYLADRIQQGDYPGRTLEELWAIREQCIAALGQ